MHFGPPFIVEPLVQAYGWPPSLRACVQPWRLRGVRLARLDVFQAEQGRSQGLCQRGHDRLGRRTGRTPVSASTTGLPAETDLVFARMAIVDVLTRGSKEISAPWENPSSGARGTVTPIASAYNKDG